MQHLLFVLLYRAPTEAYLYNDDYGAGSSQLSYITIHARNNIGHSFTDGDQHAQQLLCTIAAWPGHEQLNSDHPPSSTADRQLTAGLDLI